MPTQQEEIKEQILEWNSYLPEVKKQSIDVLVANIISLAVAQREKEMVEAIKETYFWKTCKIYFTPEQRQHFLSIITKPNDKQNN